MKEQMEAAKAAKVPEIPRKRFNVRTVAPLFGVIFVTLLFAILTKGSILKLSNVEVIINQAVFTILAGTGAIFVYAYGGIDLSIGALQGICSLVVVLLLRAGCPAPLTLVASIATGLLSGLLTGGLSVWLGIAVFITSLCMNFIMRGILQTVTATAMMYIPPEFAATDNWTLKVIVLLIVLAIGFMFTISPESVNMNAPSVVIPEQRSLPVSTQESTASLHMCCWAARSVSLASLLRLAAVRFIRKAVPDLKWTF